MALIDPKNVVAPLTNKVHLTFILLAAVLLVILRFSGGTVTREYLDTDTLEPGSKITSPRKKAPSRAVSSTEPSSTNVNRHGQSRGTQEPASYLEPEVVLAPEEMPSSVKNARPLSPWENNTPGAVKATPKPSRLSDSSSTSLDEIERELGLKQ